MARIATAPPEPAFHIDVRFLGGLTAAQEAAFETAAARWGQGKKPGLYAMSDVLGLSR